MLKQARFFAVLGPLALALAGCPEDPIVGVDGSRPDGSSVDGARGDGGVMDSGVDRCAAGVDSDNDGIDNATECMLGSDPMNSDSDRDGVPDGVEARYPRICVASDPMQQRRCVGGAGGDAGAGDGGADAGRCAPPPCTMDSECLAGERCRGLDPASNDSDMDGVTDDQEDLNRDGFVDIANGETDPRLGDTDGDGRPDNMSGVEICRPMGLASVTIARTPMTPSQVGHDPAWGMARSVDGTMTRGALLLDDAATNTTGLVAGLPSTGDVRAEAARVEMAVQTALGAGTTAVLVGRALVTHEMHNGVQSTYRVARATSASALRDALVMPLIGAAAPAGAPVIGMASEFFVDVTTVLRDVSRTVDVIVAIAPRAQVDNAMVNTAIRMADLTNSTAVSEAGKTLGFACQVIRAEQGTAPVDFVWTVDTSGSMGDDQARLGNTATAFFSRMQTAGVDFRVGVFQAGSNVAGPNLDMPGFTWISGSDPNGPRRLCEEVTSDSLGNCPTSPTDALSPYTYAGGQEEPTAAAVLTHFTMSRRPASDVRGFRAGAKVVTFHVTDEPGSNDYGRYFQNNRDPQTMMPWGSAMGAAYNATALTNIISYFRRNSILTFGLVPVSAAMCTSAPVNDLPRCVIEGNGGAVIPITTATAAEVDAAMARIVDAIAGAASQFRLNRSPITSTIKVRVRGMDVPRNRAEGFDYDAASRSIIFFGARYRPMRGDEVVISYRVWEGSLG